MENFEKLFEITNSSKEIFKGKILHLFEDKITLPNGHTTTREVIRHIGAVVIVALTDDNKVIIEKQFRYPFNKVLVEIPAGKLDPGEEPHQCALRELKEEAGVIPERLVFIGDLYPTPAYCDEVIHMYMATGLKYVEQNLDDDEFLEVVHMPYTELKKAIFTGEICDAKTQAAFLKADYILHNIKKK